MNTIREIEEMAKKVLRDTNVFMHPVGIIEIANFYGFHVFSGETNKIASAILADDKPINNFSSNRVIIYNHQLSGENARYVIAQSLAHWFLNGMPKKEFGKQILLNEYDESIRDAQIFARSLLLPLEEIQQYKWYDIPNNYIRAEFASNGFGVPVECALRRFQDIRIMEDEG